MNFLIYDKETGVIAKLVGVPNPDFLHLNNTNEDAYVQVKDNFFNFDDDMKVIESETEIFIERLGERLDIVVDGGYRAHNETS